MSEFFQLFDKAEAQFEIGYYAQAKAGYLRAIDAEPNHVDVFRAISKVELIEEMLASRGWYGEPRPNSHAICLFGSVPESSREPSYAHYAFFGKAAYDAFQTSYYLQDLFRFRRYKRLVQPTFLLLYLAIKATRSGRVEFLELGSTLFAAYEKLANCQRFLNELDAHTVEASNASLQGGAGNRTGQQIDFMGIELSNWLREVSVMVHAGVPLRLYASHADVPAPASPRFSFSLGVANYAFEATPAFAQWTAQSRFVILRERFTLGTEFRWGILGKRFMCFSLPEFAALVARLGRKVSLLSFCEAPPFLQATDSRPPAETVFIDAYVAVHDLREEEIQRFAQSIAQYRLGGATLTFNTTPSFALDSSILSRDLHALENQQWLRSYIKHPGSQATTDSRPGETQFCFTSDLLINGLKAHVDALDRIYSGSRTGSFE
jgi:hypothetical protein